MEDNERTWVTLVHILGEESKEEDFGKLESINTSLLRQSAKRSQLISQTADGQQSSLMPLLQNRRRHLDENLYSWTSQECKYLHPGVKVTIYYKINHRGIRVQVETAIAQLNLVESGVIVNISIDEPIY